MKWLRLQKAEEGVLRRLMSIERIAWQAAQRCPRAPRLTAAIREGEA